MSPSKLFFGFELKLSYSESCASVYAIFKFRPALPTSAIVDLFFLRFKLSIFIETGGSGLATLLFLFTFPMT